MKEEMSLKEAILKTLEIINKQSPEEYLSDVRKHQDGPISLTMKSMEVSEVDMLKDLTRKQSNTSGFTFSEHRSACVVIQAINLDWSRTKLSHSLSEQSFHKSGFESILVDYQCENIAA